MQRGSDFGALAAGIGKIALPLALKFLRPTTKKIGRDVLVQGAPELVEVATKRISAKQALKNTVAKTARKQIGRSLQSHIARDPNTLDLDQTQFFTGRIISRKPRPRVIVWIFSCE